MISRRARKIKPINLDQTFFTDNPMHQQTQNPMHMRSSSSDSLSTISSGRIRHLSRKQNRFNPYPDTDSSGDDTVIYDSKFNESYIKYPERRKLRTIKRSKKMPQRFYPKNTRMSSNDDLKIRIPTRKLTRIY